MNDFISVPVNNKLRYFISHSVFPIYSVGLHDTMLGYLVGGLEVNRERDREILVKDTERDEER